MSTHVYHDLHVHLNWHTKHDHRTLTGQVEELAHTLLRDKAARMKGVHLHRLGGTDDHVHLAVQIEPYVCISDLVAELKGACSFETNKRLRHKALEWQRGYGAVSFGRRNLGWVIEYIERQREHHAAGKVFARLEAFEPEDGGGGEKEGGGASPGQAG